MLLALAVTAACTAGEIILPSPALERDSVIQASYRTNGLATGKGEIAITWTDVHGRLVDDRKIPFELTDEDRVGFPLDLRRAAAMKNTLHAHFSFEGRNKKGEADKREEDAEATFLARPPSRQWRDYIIMMWQDYNARDFRLLKTLGINGGQYVGRNNTPPDFLLDNDLRWYAENIATDFYSAYHRWFPDRPVNWLFRDAKELYKKDPANKEAFKRHPSLSDPLWLSRIHDRLVESVKRYSPYRPVFYDLGDESGIADLAAFWDFDFSDESLVPMRLWLRERYGTLAALNRQWGTSFSNWDSVMPMTTNEAMRRTDDNYSAWADFKEWMDMAYAGALKMGVDAVRSADPDAYAGIAGGQMPGWGGYDYYRLSQSLTAIEPYDIGNNIEILRSLNPRMAVVTTAFAHGPWEKHRVWYELLHGNRGLIIWDDKNEFVGKDGTVGDRGREVAPYYKEIASGMGALLINSTRLADPIAIHYSQASMRTEWMLAQKPKGDVWALRRSAADERIDNHFLRLRESWCRLIEDLGLQYNFVAYRQIEQGELLKRGYRVLILPRSSALSAAEALEIRAFAAQGGTVIADGRPGTFDEHSRKRENSILCDLLPDSASGNGRGKITLVSDMADYHQNRLTGKEGPAREIAQRALAASGVRPEYVVADESGQHPTGIETHLFRNGGVTIVGLLTNPQLRVDELGPPEFKSNDRFAKPRTVKLALPREMYVYNVRASKSLGRQKEITVALDPYEPAIFTASPVAIAELEILAPAHVKQGESAEIGVGFAQASPAATHVFHLDVIDPAGRTVDHYSGNIIAPGGHAAKLLPIAANDARGKWTLRVQDLLSGQTRTVAMEVD
ncbi:MAG TPA: alpha-amylase family protein [Bryobacteraceae bacterium]|nr:alpha-amylase family protein [Bryobacteraceae bacterium]